ncbi:MAG: bifunctional oligoribonuclease/PAP phosphatase NrnA [Clostridiales Family XIII bacterium]|jgi:phosphoesterase RecJ-like protein|nr:bifunctional oligoribonuclease/PAP phosphatase NrnA [Clostridiales Family XIII bacterium]
MNNSKEEILNLLCNSKKIFIFPHAFLDGDAFGSAIALTLFLKAKKIKCKIIVDEDIAYILRFLEVFVKEDIIFLNNYDSNESADLGILIDSGDIKRISAKSRKNFEKSKTKLCIDHHKTSSAKFDYNYIFDTAAATCEIVFDLLKSGEKTYKTNISKEIATALYTGIMTDTGRFSFSNVNKKTFLRLAYLLEKNADKDLAFFNIYENIRIGRALIEGDCLLKLKTYYKGLLGVSYLTNTMLEKRNALYEDGDAVIGRIREIKGIEVAVFIKERKDGKIKVSLRSKTNFDVADFAAKFGGGGHSRAAGFDSDLSVNQMRKEIIKEKYWAKLGE